MSASEWKLRHTDPDGGWECARIVTEGPKKTRKVICTHVINEETGYLIEAAPALLESLEKAVDRQGFTNAELIEARARIARAKGSFIAKEQTNERE